MEKIFEKIKNEIFLQIKERCISDIKFTKTTMKISLLGDDYIHDRVDRIFDSYTRGTGVRFKKTEENIEVDESNFYFSTHIYTI